MAEDGIGLEVFGWARREQRLRRAAEQFARREDSVHQLWVARDGFIAAADDAQGTGSGAAWRDADRLEALAERLVDFVRSLEPALDRLEVATERSLRRTGLAVRSETPFDAFVLSDILAEALAEALLGEQARAVLVAAARKASA